MATRRWAATTLVMLSALGCDDGGAGGAVVDAAPTRIDAGASLDAAPGPDAGPIVDAEPFDLALLGPFDAVPYADARADAAPPPGDAGPGPCTDEPPMTPQMWRRPLDSPDVVDDGAPHHSAVDPVVNPHQPITLDGKFAYGTFSRDLQHERVHVWVRFDDCHWTQVGVGDTDGDGRVSVAVPVAEPLAPGRYAYRMVVGGDLSAARGEIWVVPPNKQAVVFDIDGTLTVSDRELFEEILLGHDPEPYAGGVDVTARYAEQGYLVVYMTGRPYFLNPASRAWLERHGYPPGPLRTTDSVADTAPTRSFVGAYKLAWLQHLRDPFDGPGLHLTYAYGNATTDICAYAEAGVPPADTWIIGPHAGEACDDHPAPNALADYPSHLPSLADLPRAMP